MKKNIAIIMGGYSSEFEISLKSGNVVYDTLDKSKYNTYRIHIFEDKLPIDPEVINICEEFKINPTTAVLNGGEDYELLCTIKQSDYDKIKSHPLVSIIGHVTDFNSGCQLITGLGQQIPLTAQGWQSFKGEED